MFSFKFCHVYQVVVDFDMVDPGSEAMVESTQPRSNSLEQRPCVRARVLKETLAFLDEHRPELARMVEVDAPSETLCAIREALPMDWISAKLTRGLIEVIVDELGENDGINLWRDLVTYRLRHSSMIGSLISLATTVGLAAPWSFAKQVPRGWNHSYQDYGSPTVNKDGSQAATFRWSDVPEYLFEHPIHFVAIRGALIGVIELSGQQANSELEFIPDKREVTVCVRWRDPSIS